MSQVMWKKGVGPLGRTLINQAINRRRLCSSPAESSTEFYDIVIAGGGLVGTTLALALGSLERLSNKRILLLESASTLVPMKGPDPAKASAENPDFSNRVVAISPSSRAFLKRLGVWDKVWREQPVASLQVTDALSDAYISFHNDDYAEPVTYIVENAVLGKAIADVLEKETKNVDIRFGSSLKACTIPSTDRNSVGMKALATLKDDKTITTDLLVGADGFNSVVRRSMGGPFLGFNYDRTALVGTLKLVEATDNRSAWQRFLPSGGPIAILPLSSQYSSLVWSTTPEEARKLVELPPEEFVDAVNSAFWREHSKSEMVKTSQSICSSLGISGSGHRMYPPSIGEVVEKSRATFPLGFGHAAHYVSRRIALIGDAAHRVHPLAGQGLNLGIGDVQELQRVLNEAAGMGGDIGSLHFLSEYETNRQRHNVAIQGGIDLLHRLYDTQFPPLVALRSIGLSLVNSSGALKTAIMSQAAA